MLHLIEDILDLSKIQFNSFEQNLTWFSLQRVIDDVFDMVDFQALDKGIDLQFHQGELADIEVLSDMKRIKQVLLNLVSNALKFTF